MYGVYDALPAAPGERGEVGVQPQPQRVRREPWRQG